MKARTLILTAGAVAAFAVPSVAGAKTLPVKHNIKNTVKVVHVTSKTTKTTWFRQGQPVQLLIFAPLPEVSQSATVDSTQSDAASTDAASTDASAMSSDDDC
jgi:hypothetical protein